MKVLRILHPLFCIAIGLFLVSCGKNQQPDPETTESLSPAKNFSVNQKEALSVLSRAAAIALVNGRTSDTTSGVINDIKDFRNEQGQIIFFVINYKNDKGFTLLSADRRLKPILAFSDEGRFDPKTDNPGIRLWADLINENFQAVQKQTAAHIDVTNYWKQLESGQFNGSPSSAPEWTPQASCEYYQNHPVPTNVIISHLTHNLSAWGQGKGYNAFCPNVDPPNCSSEYCGRSFTGCGPVAVAQVLRYYRKPITTNIHFYSTEVFNAMPQTIPEECNPTNANHINVAQLIRDVGKDMGAVYNTTVPGLGIPVSGSGCQTWSMPGKIDNFFSSHGYTSYSLDFFANYGAVKTELLASRPVVVFGSNCDVCLSNAHIWIIDGIRDLYNVFVDVNGYCYESNSVYFQMNWGWDGRENGGWFGYNNMVGQGITYNSSNMKAYIVKP